MNSTSLTGTPAQSANATPSPVVRANSLKSTIKTATGIVVEMKDK